MSTFYVSLLNPELVAVGTAGTFAGAVVAQTPNLLVLPIEIPLADIASNFQFQCANNTNDDGEIENIDVTGILGATTTSSAPWTFPAADSVVVARALAGDKTGAQMSTAFLSELVLKVFGSLGAYDFFGNSTQVKASWGVATQTALANLKLKTYDYGITASKQLIDAMFHSSTGQAERFSMGYGFAITEATTPSAVEGVAVSGGSGTGAVVAWTTKGMSVVTAGSGYVAGDTISVAGAGSGTATINSVQAAMLNNTLVSAPTIVPLEVDDVIRIKFQINSNAAQKDASGDDVAVVQIFHVDYILTAAN